MATARAGNVIGGGDWAADRLVPDLIRAALAGEPVEVRSPDAVRPWQHVLNPLSGYLRVVEGLLAGDPGEAWNFGPDPDGRAARRRIVERLAERWPAGIDVRVRTGRADGRRGGRPAAGFDARRASACAGRRAWDLEAGLAATVDWYAALRDGGDMRATTASQIEEFTAQ